MMIILFLVGCAMTFPVLLPVNGTDLIETENLIIATGGGGQTGLDVLSFSNAAGDKNRFFAHVFVGWLFIGFFAHLTSLI